MSYIYVITHFDPSAIWYYSHCRATMASSRQRYTVITSITTKVARAEAMVFRAKAKAKAGEDHKEDKGGKDKGGKDDKEDNEGKDKGETGEAQCKGGKGPEASSNPS